MLSLKKTFFHTVLSHRMNPPHMTSLTTTWSSPLFLRRFYLLQHIYTCLFPKQHCLPKQPTNQPQLEDIIVEPTAATAPLSLPSSPLGSSTSHLHRTSSSTSLPHFTSSHPMTTRGNASIHKPIDRLNLHIAYVSRIPRSHLKALQDPHWHKAMDEECHAVISNGTWKLVPRPRGVNILRSMWLFKQKFNADGSLSCYKARLVAIGRSQQPHIDCDETFSPVLKPATI